MDPEFLQVFAHCRSWHPPDSWGPGMEPAERLSDWQDEVEALLDAPEFAPETRDALGGRPSPDQNTAWLGQFVLRVPADQLPGTRSLTAEECLAFCNGEYADLVELAEQLAGRGALEFSEGPEGTELFWNEDFVIGESPAIQSVLFGCDKDEARRMLSLGRIEGRSDLHWLAENERMRLLEELLPMVEADVLDGVETELSEQIDRDEELLQKLRHHEEVTGRPVAPSDFVHRGLEGAVDAERAGREMRLELEAQYRDRDVAQGGEQRIMRLRCELNELRQRIRQLRESVE